MRPDNASSASSRCAPGGLNRAGAAVSYLFFSSFPVAFVFNAGAAWVSAHLRSTSTFTVYVKNLVAADLLMTLTLPSVAAAMLPGAADALRAFVCRYSGVVFFCSLYTSIALMGLISLDRFFKIVRPRGKALGQRARFGAAASASAWVLIFGGTAVPTVILTNRDPHNATGDFCMSMKGPAGVALHRCVVVFMEVLFWCVAVLIAFCYACITLRVLRSFRSCGSRNSRGQRRTKLRVFSVLLVFSVCFVPLHIMRVPFASAEEPDADACAQVWTFTVYNVALWLSTTNSCLDPVLYVCLCREFRATMRDLIRGISVGLASSKYK